MSFPILFRDFTLESLAPRAAKNGASPGPKEISPVTWRVLEPMGFCRGSSLAFYFLVVFFLEG